MAVEYVSSLLTALFFSLSSLSRLSLSPFCFYCSIVEGLKVTRCVSLPRNECQVTSTCVVDQCSQQGSQQLSSPLYQPVHQCLYVCTSSTVFSITDSHLIKEPSRTKRDLIALGNKELELARSRVMSVSKPTAPRASGTKFKVHADSHAEALLDPLTRALLFVRTR